MIAAIDHVVEAMHLLAHPEGLTIMSTGLSTRLPLCGAQCNDPSFCVVLCLLVRLVILLSTCSSVSRATIKHKAC